MKRSTAIVLIAAASGCIANRSHAQLEPGEPTQGFTLEDWVTNVPEVTDLAFLSDGRAVITRKGGVIAVALPDGSLQNARAAQLEVDSDSEKGLLGVVCDDRDRLFLYASTGQEVRDKHHVYTATVSASGEVSVDLSRSIIGNGLEGPANHDGGGMIIHEGQLYVGVGDTGHNASPPTNKYATCLNRANGKILRVNLDGSIPADNPLVGVDRVTGCSDANAAFESVAPDERIYAWGLRNPWRFWIDSQTDLLWIGDVGEVTEEEITVGGKGVHHGWPFREGNVVHGELGGLADCMAVTPATACVAPQLGYPRDQGVSVTGGLIPPSGCGWGAYEQRYFFADYGSGRVWTLDVKPDRSGAVAGSQRMFANVGTVVSFRMGPDGAMYIVSHAGSIKRLAPKSVPAGCASAAVTPAPTGDSGAPAPAAEPADSDSGCGCNLAKHASPGAALIALLIGGVAIAARRRARRIAGAAFPRPHVPGRR